MERVDGVDLPHIHPDEFETLSKEDRAFHLQWVLATAFNTPHKVPLSWLYYAIDGYALNFALSRCNIKLQTFTNDPNKILDFGYTMRYMQEVMGKVEENVEMWIDISYCYTDDEVIETVVHEMAHAYHYVLHGRLDRDHEDSWKIIYNDIAAMVQMTHFNTNFTDIIIPKWKLHGVSHTF
jgi:hypothetical protein